MTTCKRIAACLAATALLAACSSQNAPQQTAPAASGTASTHAATATSAPAPTSAAPEHAVRSVVERFGQRMQTISVLAPPGDVRGELGKTYGQLITPELMATWKAHPDQVVGREGSSPWPTRIVIHNVACHLPDTCHVTGKVDYITSNEVEHGGVFMHRAITLDVAHGDTGWRIAAIKLAPAPH